ncbi:MAG: hypothetical protein JKX97_08550 [Candidatus Lindowbacteria bacterium]|nr:hypothetical protein [Candidatus Lindowbacteria bacterium]
MFGSKISAKFFLSDSSTLDDDVLIPVFHEWIRKKALPELTIDVADYRHVAHGPKVMLITHEAHFIMDHANGKPGILCQRRLEGTGDSDAEITSLIKQTLVFCRRLEDDPATKDQCQFDGSQVLISFNDRLYTKNTDDDFKALSGLLEKSATQTYGSEHKIERISTDPRDLLTVAISSQAQPSLADLEAKFS